MTIHKAESSLICVDIEHFTTHESFIWIQDINKTEFGIPPAMNTV